MNTQGSNFETQLPGNSSTASFDPSAYWEERLRKNPGITGVGYTSLGKGYNEWLYRIRRRVFLRLVRSANMDWKASSVLDIGSGTGFYIQLWKEVGVGSLGGSDLTEIALSRLTERFPNEHFHQLDIGSTLHPLWNESFDVVSAFDVLFHIVDDSKYKKAIENVHSMLRPGGLFIFSDMLLHGPAQRSIHMVTRPLAEVEDLLRATGFEIVCRVPMFILMNHPADTRSRARAFLWRLFVYVTRRSELLGYLFGVILYPVELMLTATLKESPTTEILVCRKSSIHIA